MKVGPNKFFILFSYKLAIYIYSIIFYLIKHQNVCIKCANDCIYYVGHSISRVQKPKQANTSIFLAIVHPQLTCSTIFTFPKLFYIFER